MNLKSKQIIIETSNFCPYHCEMCPREKYPNRKEIMDMDLFKKIVDDSIEIGVTSYDFCGFGEPLTDKFLEKRFEYIREANPNSHIYISTNAYLLNDYFRKVVNEYVTEMKISIYGVSKEVYEKIHGKENIFEKAMNNITEFMTMDNRNTYVIGAYTLTSTNEHEMNQWIMKWEHIFDEITVWKSHNWAGLKNYRKIEGVKRSCGRPINGPPYIHVNGIVSPCCFDIIGLLPLGDMNIDTFEDIYHSLEYDYILSKHMQHDFFGLLCDKCDQTVKDDTVLVYSNKKRSVGELTSNKLELEII